MTSIEAPLDLHNLLFAHHIKYGSMAAAEMDSFR